MENNGKTQTGLTLPCGASISLKDGRVTVSAEFYTVKDKIDGV